MATDVEKYVKKCLQCVFHESIQKFQLLHSIRVKKSFQLIEFDFIEPLPVIKQQCYHIFHVMDYLFRFFITFPIETANAENVISTFEKMFILYTKYREYLLRSRATF